MANIQPRSKREREKKESILLLLATVWWKGKDPLLHLLLEITASKKRNTRVGNKHHLPTCLTRRKTMIYFFY